MKAIRKELGEGEPGGASEIESLRTKLQAAKLPEPVMKEATRELEGVASGTSNALRQFGTVLGIAVLGSVFSAFGGYTSGADFVSGTAAAQKIGAIALAAGAVLALALPAGRKAAGTEAVEPAAELAPVAG